ncbi:2455_t:CDS:1, partial [Cetraspora pellucida]
MQTDSLNFANSFNFADLPTPLQNILPSNHTYKIKGYTELEPIVTSEK